MKKLFFISIPSIITVIIVFLVVQLYILPRNSKGALQVTSTPQVKVYIDDKLVGTTPLCLCEPETMISTGDHTLRLSPSGEGLTEYEENIKITKSVLTVVDRKFGKGATSEGSTISLAPLKSSKEVSLLVTSNPPKADIFLDNAMIGATPLLLKDITESDHTLKIRKDGYNEKIIRIRTPLGYQLLAIVNLSVSDLATTGISPTPTLPLATPSASLSVTPSPSGKPSLASETVIILPTPNGFLRVRETNSTTAKEVARVTRDEEFPLLDEDAGWYQIKLANGTIGWVSGQYAKKQ